MPSVDIPLNKQLASYGPFRNQFWQSKIRLLEYIFLPLIVMTSMFMLWTAAVRYPALAYIAALNFLLMTLIAFRWTVFSTDPSAPHHFWIVNTGLIAQPRWWDKSVRLSVAWENIQWESASSIEPVLGFVTDSPQKQHIRIRCPEAAVERLRELMPPDHG